MPTALVSSITPSPAECPNASRMHASRMRAPRRRIAERLRLAHQILRIHYVQPATALWRLFEVEEVLEQLRGREQGRGLDIGCGDGSLARVLLTSAPEIVWRGLDVDERDAELARRRGLYESVHVCSAAAVPESADSVNVVLANSVLEHINELDAVLADVARVLAPGGAFVFTVPSDGFRACLFWPRILSALGLRGASERYVRHLDRRVAHRNYLSSEEWRTKLAHVGLTVTSEVQYLSRRTIGWWETLANLTGGLAYLLGGARLSPRILQQRAGVLEHEHRWLGTLSFVLLSPVLLLTAAQGPARMNGCLCIEAAKLETPSRT